MRLKGHERLLTSTWPRTSMTYVILLPVSFLVESELFGSLNQAFWSLTRLFFWLVVIWLGALDASLFIFVIPESKTSFLKWGTLTERLMLFGRGEVINIFLWLVPAPWAGCTDSSLTISLLTITGKWMGWQICLRIYKNPSSCISGHLLVIMLLKLELSKAFFRPPSKGMNDK